MEQLLRTQVDRVLLADSITLSQLEELRDQGLVESRMVTVEEMFSQYPRAQMSPEADRLGHNGNPVPASLLTDIPSSPCRMYDSGGVFLGIYRYEEEGDRFCPQKMFLKR